MSSMRRVNRVVSFCAVVLLSASGVVAQQPKRDRADFGRGRAIEIWANMM